MDFKFLRKGVLIGMLISAVVMPGPAKFVRASEPHTATKVQIDKGCLAFITEDIAQYVETNLHTAYTDTVFGQNEEGSYIYIRSEASEDSEWLGKLYNGNVAKVLGTSEGWTQISSGTVTGYVMTEDLMTGEPAEAHAKTVMLEKNPDLNVEALPEAKVREVIAACFTCAESKEEEAVRKAAERQAVVDFAVQFSGNPYVWGGESLTNGADCSGFVKSVYAQFGYSMPHSSSAMRHCGTEVSYSEVQPGDVICYPGHVGIYAGNGKIINAIDDAHGIGLSSATYASIITVRRMIQ